MTSIRLVLVFQVVCLIGHFILASQGRQSKEAVDSLSASFRGDDWLLSSGNFSFSVPAGSDVTFSLGDDGSIFLETESDVVFGRE